MLPGRKNPGRNAAPEIVPGAPLPKGARPRDLIPIVPGPGRAAGGHDRVDPWAFWDSYYRPHRDPKKDHDESAEDLRSTLTLLNVNRKFADVQAALVAYLRHRPKNAEPWMYEALALAIEMNTGKPEEVKQALGYSADLAVQSDNPNHLVSVADQLYLHGLYDRVGPLLDRAMVKVPHRAEPMMMSINLAQKQKDPKRMASSIDALLSLGWPGVDDTMRKQARQQAELLAKTLREEGREAEAKTLIDGLPSSEARDLFIRMTWTGDADLDLRVDEPLGATARYNTPRTVFGGAILKNGYGSHPEEIYVCPRAFDGDYTIHADVIADDPKKPTATAKLEVILHEGTPDEQTKTFTMSLSKRTSDPVVVSLSEGRRKLALPYVVPTVPEPSRRKPKAKKAGDPNRQLPAPKAKASR